MDIACLQIASPLRRGGIVQHMALRVNNFLMNLFYCWLSFDRFRLSVVCCADRAARAGGQRGQRGQRGQPGGLASVASLASLAAWRPGQRGGLLAQRLWRKNNTRPHGLLFLRHALKRSVTR